MTENKIFARKCEIKEISSKESKNFVNQNHIQGNAPSTIKIGLFFKEKLVSVMTFGKRPMFNSNEYEIIRFCNILNTMVVGGEKNY